METSKTICGLMLTLHADGSVRMNPNLVGEYDHPASELEARAMCSDALAFLDALKVAGILNRQAIAAQQQAQGIAIANSLTRRGDNGRH